MPVAVVVEGPGPALEDVSTFSWGSDFPAVPFASEALVSSGLLGGVGGLGHGLGACVL